MLPIKRTIGILPWTEKSYQEKEWSESFVYSLQEKNETCDDHEKYIKRKTAALRGLYEKCERILLGSHCPAQLLLLGTPPFLAATPAQCHRCFHLWCHRWHFVFGNLTLVHLFLLPNNTIPQGLHLWCHSFWHFSVIALEFWYRADLCSCHISPMPMPHVIYRYFGSLLQPFSL